MPEPVKRLCVALPFKWRMGKSYRRTLVFLAESQHWPIERAEEYQLVCLKRLLGHAYATVPYYKQVFDRLEFHPSEVSSLADVEQLPLLSRDDVAENYDRLVSSMYGRFNSYEGMTGGTTGASLRVLFDVRSSLAEWAFIHTLWARIGYSANHRRVGLTGAHSGEHHGKIKYDPFHNELQLSTFAMDEATLDSYAVAVARFRPHYLYGFPSALTVFSTFVSETRRVPAGIKGILCGSEQLTDEQIQLLEKTFGCPVYSWYGQTERVTLAGECEYSRDYHIFSEYGYTELVDEKGDVIRNAGQRGEIVATGFVNYAMPLVRYRTGDMSEYSSEPCPCGRPYRRLSRLVGRREGGYLIDRFGVKILLSSINTQIAAFGPVRQTQFVQTEPGRFRLNILATPGVSSVDAEAVRRALVAQVQGRAEVEVSLVPDLVRTARGKVKPCVQALEY